MKSLKQFVSKLDAIPAMTSWYLADINEAKGRQELYKKQSPQKLKSLREYALIESAISFNHIEVVGIDMMRKVLKDLRSQRIVECLGRGSNAKWNKTGN